MGLVISFLLGCALLIAVELRRRLRHTSTRHAPTEPTMNMAEACTILNIDENADEEQILQAHRQWMQKLHPDTGGHDYFAKQLNAARDYLLQQKRKSSS